MPCLFRYCEQLSEACSQLDDQMARSTRMISGTVVKVSDKVYVFVVDKCVDEFQANTVFGLQVKDVQVLFLLLYLLILMLRFKKKNTYKEKILCRRLKSKLSWFEPPLMKWLERSHFLRTCYQKVLADIKGAEHAVESHSFCMNLFRGRAVTKQVFPYPLNLDDDRKKTLQMIVGPTEKFLLEVNDVAKNDETMDIPKEVLAQFAELGAFGAVGPVEYEGAGMNNSQMARLAEVVGANDLGLGVVMGAHQSITSRAELSADGKHYVLNGSKIWISNGGFAQVFTVFAQVPCKQADGSTKDKVTAFIVERGFGGLTNGPQEKKMGIKGSNTTEVFFDNVKIPVENLLGKEGEGFKVAMNILNNGRFGIPAACTGAMKHCIQKTVDHITTRVQFGKKLEEFGNVQEKLANMVARHYATESIVYMLAANMDRGVSDYQIEAAIGKVAASENAWWVCDESIQLHGGMGFMKETGLERVLRDLRIFRIFEGANDVMRLFVALTGSMHAGKHLQQLEKEIKSGGLSALFGEIVTRTTGGNTGADFASVVHSSLSSEEKVLDECIALFGKTVRGLLTQHKKVVIDHQFELVRVADAAIDIYSMIATLSRCTNSIQKNSHSAAHEVNIARFFVHIASRRALDNLKIAGGDVTKETSLIETISRTVCKNGGMPQQHPVEV